MVAGGANEGGFCYLSHREHAALMDAVRRDVEAFPDGSVVEELYGEVCEFLDAHEATPVVGSTEFVERSLNRGFGLLASVRGYMRMLSIIEETDSLVFCNRVWQDGQAFDATMGPVFEAVERGVLSTGPLATLVFAGGVALPAALRPRRFGTIFPDLPLFSRRPSVEGGAYMNDLPADLALAVNRTQLAELARHLLTGGRPNQNIFGEQNTLQEPVGCAVDWSGCIDRACEMWRELHPDVRDPAFHLIISDIEMWSACQISFRGGALGHGIGREALHWCPEVAQRYDGPGAVWFLVAEPYGGRAAFDAIRFTDVNAGLHHTPTLGVRPSGDGRFDMLLDLRLRVDVQEPHWVVGVVVA